MMSRSSVDAAWNTRSVRQRSLKHKKGGTFRKGLQTLESRQSWLNWRNYKREFKVDSAWGPQKKTLWCRLIIDAIKWSSSVVNFHGAGILVPPLPALSRIVDSGRRRRSNVLWCLCIGYVPDWLLNQHTFCTVKLLGIGFLVAMFYGSITAPSSAQHIT